jgi:Tol biopolymer transport system component
LKSGDGKAAGPPQQVTTDTTGKIDVTVSAEGAKLAWTAYSSQRTEIRVRETATGREDAIVCSNKTLNLMPKLSPDGSQLAYSDFVAGKRISFIAQNGLPPQQVAAEGNILGFFSQSSGFLVASGNRLDRLAAVGSRRSALLDTSGQGELYEAALSPSDRWIVFTVALADGSAALYLAKVDAQPAAAGTWTKLAGGPYYIGSPAWSSDGRIVYYGSYQDGFVCVWAQRIAEDGKPDGDPFAAFHNHASPDMKFYGASRVAAAPDRLYMMLSDFRGDLWSLKLPR